MKKRVIRISLIIALVLILAILVGVFNNRTNITKNDKVAKIEASTSKTYTVMFDENGGDTGPQDMTVEAGNIIMPSVVPKKNGYAFLHWKIRGSNVSGYPNQTFYNIQDYADSNGQVYFEAEWGYKITFDANGGYDAPSEMVSTGGNITIPVITPYKPGSAFFQWKVKGTDIAGRPNQTFYKVEDYVDNNGVLAFVADWGYKITFDANGGYDAPSEILSTGGNITIPLEIPEKTGYTFLQWKVKDTNVAGRPGQTFFSVQSYTDNDGVLAFVADWGYEITYNANGGLHVPSSQVKREGETITLSEMVPTREGYKFLGWSTNSSATTATYFANGEFSENANTTLYAVWEKEKAVYTITYDANGGTNKPENQTKQEGISITLSNVIPTREGYKFLGWSTNSSATTATYFANGEFSENANTTLYAVWEKEKAIYTITYDVNGGTNKPENQTKQEGISIKLSSVIPTRKGYKFLGWSTNKNATTATYAANATFSEDGNITLYAVWEKEKSTTNEINNTTGSDITNTITNIVSNVITNTTGNVVSNTIKNDIVNDIENNTIKNDVSENNIVDDNNVEDDSSDKNIIDDNTIDGNSAISGKDNEVKNKVEKNAVSANNPDNTKSKTALPKAGMNTLKSVIILVVIISLIFGFKYKSTKLS